MKISIVGTIDDTHTKVSGQYDRTEIVKDGLKVAGYDVRFSNMMYWKTNPIKVFYNIIKNYFWSDAVIIVASLNGVRMNLNILKTVGVFSKRPAFQIAVGGKSNCDFVKNEAKYRKLIKRLCGVFVEIAPMVDEYKNVGIDKVFYLPNCKKIDKTSERVEPSMAAPYRFCTYSRVTPEKGIKEAVEAVERLNKKYGENYCTLDIYGTYLPEDHQWFEDLMAKASKAITYKARIERKDSIKTLGQYDLMLFPTKHVGEGVPGGMIDCYEAGLPIVVCNTSFMSTVVLDGKSGFVYEGDDDMNLDKAIVRYTEGLTNSEKKSMRKKCIDMAYAYDTSSVIETLSQHLDAVKK